LQQFFDGRRPAAIGTPVRVFPAVAATPRLPERRWWNNPLGVLPATVAISTALAFLPGLPALTGLVALAIGFALAVVEAISYFSWPESRNKAAAEGVWVAHQSGYRVWVHQDGIRWIDPDGIVKVAIIVRGDTGWDLVLTDQNAIGNFVF
jgi:hypothetical protein